VFNDKRFTRFNCVCLVKNVFIFAFNVMFMTFFYNRIFFIIFIIHCVIFIKIGFSMNIFTFLNIFFVVISFNMKRCSLFNFNFMPETEWQTITFFKFCFYRGFHIFITYLTIRFLFVNYKIKLLETWFKWPVSYF